MKLKIIFLTISSTLLLLILSGLSFYYHPLCDWGYKTRYLSDSYFFNKRSAWEWRRTGLMKDVYLPDEVPRDVVEKLFVSARGEPYVKYRRALNMVYDVSTWKPGEDVVIFDAWRREYDTLVMTSFDTGDTIVYEIRKLSSKESFYSSTLFLYPWKGEDTIFYELSYWALTVNGRQVGRVLFPYLWYSETMGDRVDPKDYDMHTQGIVTLSIREYQYGVTLQRLKQFEDLEVIFMTLYRTDYAYSYYYYLYTHSFDISDHSDPWGIRYKERSWFNQGDLLVQCSIVNRRGYIVGRLDRFHSSSKV